MKKIFVLLAISGQALAQGEVVNPFGGSPIAIQKSALIKDGFFCEDLSSLVMHCVHVKNGVEVASCYVYRRESISCLKP